MPDTSLNDKLSDAASSDSDVEFVCVRQRVTSIEDGRDVYYSVPLTNTTTSSSLSASKTKPGVEGTKASANGGNSIVRARPSRGRLQSRNPFTTNAHIPYAKSLASTVTSHSLRPGSAADQAILLEDSSGEDEDADGLESSNGSEKHSVNSKQLIVHDSSESEGDYEEWDRQKQKIKYSPNSRAHYPSANNPSNGDHGISQHGYRHLQRLARDDDHQMTSTGDPQRRNVETKAGQSLLFIDSEPLIEVNDDDDESDENLMDDCHFQRMLLSSPTQRPSTREEVKAQRRLVAQTIGSPNRSTPARRCNEAVIQSPSRTLWVSHSQRRKSMKNEPSPAAQPKLGLIRQRTSPAKAGVNLTQPPKIGRSNRALFKDDREKPATPKKTQRQYHLEKSQEEKRLLQELRQIARAPQMREELRSNPTIASGVDETRGVSPQDQNGEKEGSSEGKKFSDTALRTLMSENDSELSSHGSKIGTSGSGDGATVSLEQLDLEWGLDENENDASAQKIEVVFEDDSTVESRPESNILSVEDQSALSQQRRLWKSQRLSAYFGSYEGVMPLLEVQNTHDDIPPVDVDTELPETMHFVKHLCKSRIGSTTGLPIWDFVVHGGCDNILYCFTVKAKQSRIPQSGNGLFFTFNKALQLKPQFAALAGESLKQRVYFEAECNRDLEFVATNGCRTSLGLTGSDLDSAHGKAYVAETMTNLKGVHDNSKTIFNLKLVGEDLHYDFGEEPIPDGIGFLGKYREIDYVLDKGIKYSSKEGSIELGLYGPFRLEDRKIEPLFTAKNWILSFSPQEWPFEAAEPLYNHVQILDITSDSTGEPHETARKNLPMYVNEIGYSGSRQQNVFIMNRDGRSSTYYIKVDNAMKQGETIELLTNYKKGYEAVRERHGYGWRNVHGTLKSDICSFPTQLSRNFDERDDFIHLVDMTAFVDLFEILLFIKEEIWQPINSLKSEVFSAESKTLGALTSKQWVALRRLHWLRDKVNSRLSDQRENLCIASADDFPLLPVLDFAESLLDELQWSSFTDDLQLIKQQSNCEAEVIYRSLERELVEEVCFELKDVIVLPLNTSMWCPIARDLIQNLSLQVASMTQTSGEKKELQDQSLVAVLFAEAGKAGEKVRVATLDELSFDCGLEPGFVLPGSMQASLSKLQLSGAFFLDHSTAPKGYIAAVASRLGYYDALEVAGLESHSAEWFDDQSCEQTCFMCSGNYDCENVALTSLASIPKFASHLVGKEFGLNRTWYLVWQVAFVVHSFASKFVTPREYSLTRLCDMLNLELDLVEFAVRRGIRVRSMDEFKGRVKIAETRDNAIAQPVNRRLETNLDLSKDSRKLTRKQNNSKSSRKAARAPTDKTSVYTAKGGLASNGGRPPALLIWEGVPNESLHWPSGWTKRVFQRQSGKTKGSTDNYWYSPLRQFKLRSLVEVHGFLQLLDTCNGDEDTAIMLFKKK